MRPSKRSRSLELTAREDRRPLHAPKWGFLILHYKTGSNKYTKHLCRPYYHAVQCLKMNPISILILWANAAVIFMYVICKIPSRTSAHMNMYKYKKFRTDLISFLTPPRAIKRRAQVCTNRDQRFPGRTDCAPASATGKRTQRDGTNHPGRRAQSKRIHIGHPWGTAPPQWRVGTPPYSFHARLLGRNAFLYPNKPP